MKRISALFATAMLALCFGVAQAAAEEGDSGAAQAAGQSADSGQTADGSGGAYQVGPSNSASSIRVLSPGDSGDVTQSNTTTAAAVAANANRTTQDVDQSQSGGSGSDYAQIAGQEASNWQDADADATAKQIEPTNDWSSIRVLSPGDAGDVTQSNAASAGALAANGNETSQDTDQTQSGGGSGSDYAQIAGQAADNHQSADADATAVQLKPENTARSIRVLSPGDDGNVTQSNSTTALAAALNGNETNQSVDQSQGTAAPATAEKTDATKEKSVYPSGSDYTQIAGQSADSKQSADADATAVQIKPTNTASSIRVLSPGDDGDITQSNDATALGIAANGNGTNQSTEQSQPSGGSGSDYTQIAGQEADNHQWADADATAVQVKPTNTATSIRVLSPGDGGNVDQSNSTTALAAALNLNHTDQSIDQSQGTAAPAKVEKTDGSKEKSDHPSGSSYLQIAGQEAGNYQSADADATAFQLEPENTASSIRVLSPGDDGNVTQSNDATAVGIALNLNKTDQLIDQSQSGSGHGSEYLQVAGQGAWSWQDADADATAVQLGAKNEYAPVRVLSPNGKDRKHGKDSKDSKDNKDGNSGSIEQSNSVGALALALNLNETCQALMQSQTGYGSSSLQVGGQGAWSAQRGSADAFGLQGVKSKKK